MRVLDRGRYVARAHLCAALTRTVADSFLPLRRVDAVAAISPALFLVNTFRELFASPLVGGRPDTRVLPPSRAPAAFRELLRRVLGLLRSADPLAFDASHPRAPCEAASGSRLEYLFQV